MYDLRFDSTNGGSGPQRWDNPATWQPSRNPAVIAYNLIRGVYFGNEWVFGGRNLPAWRLPSAEWIAAANECDAPVTLAGGGTEPAWRCGIEISVDMAAADVLEEIGRAANMRFAEVGGQIKPIVGLPGAAVFSLTDDDIIITEGQSFRAFAPVAETYNAISATYPEPAEKWATKDSPEYIDAAATAEDGGRYLPIGVSYPAAPYAQQVQRLQRSQLQDYRRMRRHQFHLPPDAYALEPGVDMVSWTSARNGYAAKLFLVESVAKTRGMNVLVSLREADPGDYDWDSGFEFPVTITPPVNPLPYVQPVPGFAVSATSVRDGAGQPRRAAILVECDPGEVGVTAIHVQARIKGGGERRNLLRWSEGFENAAWNKANLTATTGYGVAPDGSSASTILRETTATGEHGLRQNMAHQLGEQHTVSIYVREAGRPFVFLAGIPADWGANANVRFDLSTGEMQIGAGVVDAGIEPVGGGWFRVWGTFTAASTGTSTLYLGTSLTRFAGVAATFAGDPTRGIEVWGFQREIGPLSAYQRVEETPVSSIVIDETYRYTAPHGWYLRDVLPLTTYEVRARLLSDLTPVSDWSAWHDVTTLDITFQIEDLSQDILDQFEAIAAEAGIATVEVLPAEGDFDNQIVMLVPQGTLYRWDETELEWTTKVYAGVGPNTVTTDALVALAVITSKIAAGAVTADKMTVNELSAITAVIGVLRTATSGARQEIHSDKLLIYDAANMVRVKIGMLS